MKKPLSPDEIREQHELDVLQKTVFHTFTKGDTIRAAIQYAYDRVLADRVMNVSKAMAMSERRAS
jgi:hypothetical protein